MIKVVKSYFCIHTLCTIKYVQQKSFSAKTKLFQDTGKHFNNSKPALKVSVFYKYLVPSIVDVDCIYTVGTHTVCIQPTHKGFTSEVNQSIFNISQARCIFP